MRKRTLAAVKGKGEKLTAEQVLATVEALKANGSKAATFLVGIHSSHLPLSPEMALALKDANVEVYDEEGIQKALVEGAVWFPGFEP